MGSHMMVFIDSSAETIAKWLMYATEIAAESVDHFYIWSVEGDGDDLDRLGLLLFPDILFELVPLRKNRTELSAYCWEPTAEPYFYRLLCEMADRWPELRTQLANGAIALGWAELAKHVAYAVAERGWAELAPRLETLADCAGVAAMGARVEPEKRRLWFPKTGKTQELWRTRWKLMCKLDGRARADYQAGKRDNLGPSGKWSEYIKHLAANDGTGKALKERSVRNIKKAGEKGWLT